MVDAIITYDLHDASDSQRRAFREVVCDKLLPAERRLRTVWCGFVVEENADELKKAVLDSVRSHKNLGGTFARNNLRMILVVADSDGAMSVAEHRTRTLDSYP